MIDLPGPLVDADWLEEHLDEVVVADVRWSIPTGPKRDDYETAHVPSAIFVDLDVDLSSPPGPRGRHPLPSAQEFAAARGRLGLVGPLIAYDDTGGATAARLWWMLDSIGVPAAVLDGGIDAWPGPLDAGPIEPKPSEVEPIAWPADRFIEAEALLAAIGDGCIALDARSGDRFRGDENPIDVRFGHVPGASSWPWQSNLAPDGRFAAPEALAERFAEAGIGVSDDLIASCGSGVTGCHVLLAARVSGIDGGRLYAGSWSEWAADPDRPIAKGDG